MEIEEVKNAQSKLAKGSWKLLMMATERNCPSGRGFEKRRNRYSNKRTLSVLRVRVRYVVLCAVKQ